jgi:tRNA modification GTPase
MKPFDTIVAPATPPGVGGLAVVRISGPESRNLLISLDRLHREPKPRQATFVQLIDSASSVFEDAVATYFQSPSSYTGEDMVEISCHGNPLIVQHLVHICCEYGARIAEPGEFTQRAFIHGKLDLIQAEAVASFIAAQSMESAHLNHRLLQGDLSQKLNTLKTDLMTLLQSVEYILDISEEAVEQDFLKKLYDKTTALSASAGRLLDTYSRGHLLTEGASVVLSGPPNSGKSTLLNRLTNTDRAITSPEPGTTRDYIDSNFVLEGIPIKLIDTAGLRESQDSIEAEGVQRTQKLMDQADVLIWIQAVDAPILTPPEKNSSTPRIMILNKSDLLTPSKQAQLQASFPDALFISALHGDGLDQLKTRLKDSLGGASMLSGEVALTTARQYESLTAFQKPIKRVLDLLESNEPSLELASFEFRDALQALDTVLGKTTPEDILNAIFSSFCVGK